jgi:type II secretory pathway predicted ATPase ExeA
MYYPHFGLKEPPFKITPNTDFFFSGGNRGAVLDALVYAITNGEGIIKVVGEVGSGKTMLCRMLQTILPEHIESIYLANPSMAPEDVLHAIAFELQLKLPKNADRLKVMQQLQMYLLERHAQGRQVVIFVEEAQGMPLATLEEIRLLSNLETKQDKLLQIVLFGQPELDVNLNETNIRQLRERITHSFQLGPLHTKDIGDYLIFRLRAAGYHGPHLFTDAAIKQLSKSAQGLVRRVNILADKALLAAFAENLYQVTPKHVKAAVKDSEFGSKAKAIPLPYLWGVASLVLLCGALVIIWPSIEFAKARHNAAPLVISAHETKAHRSKQSTVSVNASETQKVDGITLAKPIKANPLATNVANANPERNQTSFNLAHAPLSSTEAFVEKRFEASKAWLETGVPNTVTLQIMTITKDDQLKTQLELLNRQLDGDKLYLYRKNQDDQHYTVVLYGAYQQRAEALSALEALPLTIQDNNPQIRTIAGINRDIQQTQ